MLLGTHQKEERPRLGDAPNPAVDALGAGCSRLREPHRALLVDLEVRVRAHAGCSRVEVLAKRVDGGRLPQANRHGAVLAWEELPPTHTRRAASSDLLGVR